MTEKKLSWLAKGLIEECSQDPECSNLYAIYEQIRIYFPESGYTIGQVSKYLQKLRKEQETLNLLEAGQSEAPSY